MINKIIRLLIGVASGFINGIFGSGGGTVVVPSLKIVLDYEEHKAHATAISIILPLTILSIIFYAKSNFIDFNLAWQVSIGGIVGGFTGAKFLKKIPSNILRIIFGIFMIYAGVRMLFK